MEHEARFLHAGVRAGLIDADKGTAALVVYGELLKRGASFSFGDFLVERGLMGRMTMEGLERNLAAGDDQPVATISQLDEFELQELIGEGESGSVFRARKVPGDDQVAVKILAPYLAEDEQARQRFLDEGRASVRIQHPHLVRALRVALTQGLYYMAMELVGGGSARQSLEDAGGLLPEERALELCAQVADGLTAAHTAGLVHRDVKPENVLLTLLGQAKLADLGVALRTERSAVAPQLESDGSDEIWGTPDYMAPEVIQGHAPDPRSDLYSLGCMLYELLTGRPPYLGATPQETLGYHLYAAVPDVLHLRPDLKPATGQLIARLLKKDPRERFPDAASTSMALRLVLRMNPDEAGVSEPGRDEPWDQGPAPDAEEAPPKRKLSKLGRPASSQRLTSAGGRPSAKKSSRLRRAGRGDSSTSGRRKGARGNDRRKRGGRG